VERFPVELLYVLGFLAIVLFNFVAQLVARRRRQEEAQAPPPPEPPAIEEALADDVWGRAPARPAPAPVRAEAPLPRRVHPVRALLRDRTDLRRAVALSVVLGPCRAQERNP